LEDDTNEEEEEVDAREAVGSEKSKAGREEPRDRFQA
jgi:hypothetical protein